VEDRSREENWHRALHRRIFMCNIKNKTATCWTLS